MKKEFHFLKPGNLVVSIFFIASHVWAQSIEDQWRAQYAIQEPRSNPYQLSPAELQTARQQGQWHAQYYPITVTGVLPPLRPIKKILESDFQNPLIKIIQVALDRVGILKSFDEMMDWLGLNVYPQANETGVYQVYVPEERVINHRLGMGTMSRYGADGFTLSCAVCHSSNLFGKTVLGLTNRFPRANEFFISAHRALAVTPASAFQMYTFSTSAEMQLFKDMQRNMRAVGAVSPLALGLDTSLAQVALSLQKRNPDAWATKSSAYEKKPRPDYLEEMPADSKPAVWWNVKYKNRWLSDGSVISGNPILTNILWNEIGRGVDLVQLSDWLQKNGKIIGELTSAVFSTEAPRITDFFSESQIDIASAQRGEELFIENCARCHGVYHKNWSLAEWNSASLADRIKTYRVEYKKQTVVRDVGTDAYRYLGMKSLEKLNELQISKNHGIVIQAQKGYVPPPLVGIWARWPYFHNNSIPNLCELLTPAHLRKKEFYQGPAVDKTQDFDFDCNGYPAPERVPQAWKKNPEFKFDTRRKGMGNYGHDEGIFLENGLEIFSSANKKDLIHFMQTL
ncbi:MAG: cytochrome c [Bdellovibrionaceae bacterium]|nr:cytochrome c [Pseudobdellovibrionaceae bacterium]